MSASKSTTTISTISIDNYGYNIEGVSKADLGQFNDALASFTKAIEIDPENYVAYFNRASVKMRLGDIEGARIDFRKSEIFDTRDKIYA